MAKKIRVISKRVGEPFRSVWISNSLKAMQNMVGGYIEHVPLFTDGTCLICDEEGRIKGKQYNITINGIPVYRDFFVCGTDEEEFADVPFAFNEKLQKLHPEFREPNPFLRRFFNGC